MYITTYTPPFPSYAWMDKYSSSIVPHHISWPTLISLKYFERGRRFQDRGWGVCLVRVGVGAGSQKGWDGLDGGGEITNFGGERLNFWGNVWENKSELRLPAPFLVFVLSSSGCLLRKTLHLAQLIADSICWEFAFGSRLHGSTVVTRIL